MNLKHILLSERNQIGYLLGFHLTCHSGRGRTIGTKKSSGCERLRMKGTDHEGVLFGAVGLFHI